MPETPARAVPPPGPRAWLGQALLYALFALAIGVFSQWPPYRHLGSDQALVKLSFQHAGQRKEACRERSPEELAKLAPNMRAAKRNWASTVSRCSTAKTSDTKAENSSRSRKWLVMRATGSSCSVVQGVSGGRPVRRALSRP